MSDQELLAQIAQVAGAINKHNSAPATPRQFNGYNGGYRTPIRGGYIVPGRGVFSASARGSYSARGGHGRGRGAPVPNNGPFQLIPQFNRSITLNNTSRILPTNYQTTQAPRAFRPPVESVHRTLIPSNNTLSTPGQTTPSLQAPAIRPPVESVHRILVNSAHTLPTPGTTTAASSTPTVRPPVELRHRTLVNNKNMISRGGVSSPASSPSSSFTVARTAADTISPAKAALSAPSSSGQWIQSNKKNMSLMHPTAYHRVMVAKRNSIQKGRIAKLKSRQEQSKKEDDLRKGIVRVNDKVYNKSADGRKLVMRNPDQGNIVINGVSFHMDPRGKKLIRNVQTLSSSSSSSATSATLITSKPALGGDKASSQVATPKQFSMDGVDYVRTKSGNLVRSTLVKNQLLAKKKNTVESMKLAREKIMKARSIQHCKYFARSGVCTNKACRFIHSRQYLAICKRFLQGRCRYDESTCKLSHVPSPHTTPACSHFQFAACTKENCLYPHIKFNSQAPICRPFATLGWCDAGANCKNRHVWICPDFGTPKGCNGRCGLAHVENGGIKVKKSPKEIEAQKQLNPKDFTPKWSGRHTDQTLRQQQQQQQDQQKDTAPNVAKTRQYDENYIPLDFDSADEDENQMLVVKTEEGESLVNEESESESESEDVNSDMEYEESESESEVDEMAEVKEEHDDGLMDIVKLEDGW
ncbi:hypothetical protein BG004_004335 [Podila humilis]|nr:hypothetical protein BG004_004335 [Podila humilis]